jgi:hypothetical protein
MLGSLKMRRQGKKKRMEQMECQIQQCNAGIKLESALKNIKYFNTMMLSPKMSKGSWLKDLAL